MAKVQIKSEKLTPVGGIFSIMEQFDALLSQTTSSTLGVRNKLYSYQYDKILRSLMCVYFCGSSCIEDATLDEAYFKVVQLRSVSGAVTKRKWCSYEA